MSSRIRELLPWIILRMRIFANIYFLKYWDSQPCRGYNRKVVLTWDDSYAIALALNAAHPEVDIEMVSLGMVYRWAVALPDFQDDRELANEAILAAIYQEWYEEKNPL